MESAKATKKTDEYWKKEFTRYQHELTYLFETYSKDEITTLFQLLMKLYSGIDNLEEKIADENAIEKGADNQ